MWYGKIAIIMWLFSFAIFFSAGYVNQIFNQAWLTSNVTYSSINATGSTLAFNQQINTNFIFGDFLSVFTFLGNLFTGGYFNTAFGPAGIAANIGFAGYDQWISMLMGLMFTSSTIFLLLYIISFRSI